ncbi:MAG: T9SS type A sorting domain-containing protein, partial [Bacteroidetes bacterium]|nr:T9SS type A sorting domain-containing protein [Bacteroidota bacterium]
ALNIHLGSNQQALIKLYSANGSLVKQQMATERTSLNVSDLPKGIYTLLVQSGLEIKSKKVVVE